MLEPLPDHTKWMHCAIREAVKAAEANEIPVGAVVVHNETIIGYGQNQVERLKDPTAHAEMIALTSAAATLGSKWLHHCTLYVTLEPCTMCAGALVLARIDRIVFGAADPKAGACGSVFQIASNEQMNHRIEIVESVEREECSRLLAEFFRQLRQQEN